MELDFGDFYLEDKSGRMFKSSYISKNYPKHYDLIINYLKDIDIPFKERVYLFLNKLEKPICKNINCNNQTNYMNSTIGYREYCSNKCTGTDPTIIELKKQKSLIKYGTKTPSESKEVKDKMIKTNNLLYGGNSPMSSKETQEKSKNTLMSNYGVTCPSHNKDLLEKRVDSFKNNIESYKENFKKTSIEKYGVDHHWKNKDIHDKTIISFYKDYEIRIKEKIKDSKFEFIKFESNNIIFNCNDCKKDFNINAYQFYYRINDGISICTECYPISSSSSIKQTQIYNFIKENYNGDIIENYRLSDKLEIDIYIPELKIGFEFNGVYWHCDKFKDEYYHQNKQISAKNEDISLYTIWEDDWLMRKDICESFILNKLKLTHNKIMSRKCEVRLVNNNDSRSFLISNHLQGDCKSSIRLGLYHNDILVSLMCFSKQRIIINRSGSKEGIYELTRFCNLINHNVIGGASKLFSYFNRNYEYEEVETYSNNLISVGDLYKILGFTNVSKPKPTYQYIKNGIRYHRFNFRKSKLIKDGADPNKSENEIMSENGYYKIYNGGNLKWNYIKKTNLC